MKRACELAPPRRNGPGGDRLPSRAALGARSCASCSGKRSDREPRALGRVTTPHLSRGKRGSAATPAAMAAHWVRHLEDEVHVPPQWPRAADEVTRRGFAVAAMSAALNQARLFSTEQSLPCDHGSPSLPPGWQRACCRSWQGSVALPGDTIGLRVVSSPEFDTGEVSDDCRRNRPASG